jgi:hypothetical protein
MAGNLTWPRFRQPIACTVRGSAGDLVAGVRSHIQVTGVPSARLRKGKNGKICLEGRLEGKK